MQIRNLAAFLPGEAAARVIAEGDQINEIRLRAERPVQFVYASGDVFLKEIISAQQLRRIAVAMMEHSYYAREGELAQGFFTMKNGFRVGVCGSFAEKQPGVFSMRAISSLCIRVARAVPGCAEDIAARMAAEHMKSTLILSRPGMGKTTLLRDTARLLSEDGHAVGIADERHEIAACRDGVPTMDVGPRTDVVDGCPKSQAIMHLIRTMSPQVIITDEIGSRKDADAIREAVRMGVAIAASAHASSFEEFESGSLGMLAREGLFPLAFLLDGEPGKIAGIRRYDRRGNVCS